MTAVNATHLDDARLLGIAAARDAASWTVPANAEPARARRALLGLWDCDPNAYDCLPERPSLSGEWCGEQTPRTLAADVSGEEYDDLSADEIDAICDAWEAGVDETFETACEEELRRACGETFTAGLVPASAIVAMFEIVCPDGYPITLGATDSEEVGHIVPGLIRSGDHMAEVCATLTAEGTDAADSFRSALLGTLDLEEV